MNDSKSQNKKSRKSFLYKKFNVIWLTTQKNYKFLKMNFMFLIYYYWLKWWNTFFLSTEIYGKFIPGSTEIWSEMKLPLIICCGVNILGEFLVMWICAIKSKSHFVYGGRIGDSGAHAWVILVFWSGIRILSESQWCFLRFQEIL